MQFGGYGFGDDIFKSNMNYAGLRARCADGGDLASGRAIAGVSGLGNARSGEQCVATRANCKGLDILQENNTQEAVFDVACAGGVAVNPEAQRCPDNGLRLISPPARQALIPEPMNCAVWRVLTCRG